MSTTDLFVELIIIGMGSAIWIFFLATSIFGFSWVDSNKLLSLPALIPFLSLTYVVGIVVDRISDTLFEWLWAKEMFRKYYENKDDFHDDRRIIYIHEGRLASLLEYGRSRLRICRGWVLNSALTFLTLNLFAWTKIPDFPLKIQVSIFGSLFCIFLSYGTWFSWYKLTLNDFRRVKEQANFLKQFQSQLKKEIE
ncbi:hypothetical protein IQ254_23075 [Nodosilinea sp. LEGE 07088]|uniref:hypothetical protein n=1 Tax=Nodosilinea sp. LEGE 07088 TaxID=2777968 RepID=UPI00187E56BE|nr:hypothetical protein [Nodosilinea sp. LEGE 07088]MBE9140044.1 hypothetical protein [Nodosilinea sp. LEGE 07088]